MSPLSDQDSSDGSTSINRRHFLKLLAASSAFAGLAGCVRQPQEKILPYVHSPEQLIPGKATYYATTMKFNGIGSGLIVESHMGRPTKIEGNPKHPATLGATDIFSQAELFDLYNSERMTAVRERQTVRSWEQFLTALEGVLAVERQKQGAGLHLLLQAESSPTLIKQINVLRGELPKLNLHHYQPFDRSNSSQGAGLAFGRDVCPIYDFKKVRVAFALDADVLAPGIYPIRYAKDFASARRVFGDKREMNRLYVAESSVSITGAMADHRLGLTPARIKALGLNLAAALGLPVQPQNLSDHERTFLSILLRDLLSTKGENIVLAGEFASPHLHSLVHHINEKLENGGKTVRYIEPPSSFDSAGVKSLADLSSALESKTVRLLIIIGGNPAFTAPQQLRFADGIKQAEFSVYVGHFNNQTAEQCTWRIPQTHFLEEWSDALAYDGTVSIVQPLIMPLNFAKSPHEIIEVLRGGVRTSYELVKAYWDSQDIQNKEEFWEETLSTGFVADSEFPSITPALKPLVSINADSNEESQEKLFNICIRPDPTIYDGRYYQNGWLQELPKPLTKITWENAILISPNTAQKYKIQSEQVVTIASKDGAIEGPAWITAGHPDGTITVHAGYGGQADFLSGVTYGTNAYRLSSVANSWDVPAELMVSTRFSPLACTQGHHDMAGRETARCQPIKEIRTEPAQTHNQHDSSLYPEYKYPDYAWGMVIDLNVCIGCSACTIACQVENNIPIVGKDQVRRGREMHWIRVDRYYQEVDNRPSISFQPVPCMHCEKAPCEVVCPVEATMHDSEGLNVQVYNRCVGTRYCSNNCPYKVRRFNFYRYSDEKPLHSLLHNPNVTLRSRGVIEKCTYCVQRINAARIESEKVNRRIRDREFMTACEQACPTEAIIFGDINDPSSAVAQYKRQPQNYRLLDELGTKPRTTYLTKFINPAEENST